MKHMALKKNLDVTIHEAFLEEILQGNWKPGQALNLDELAERYGVSRTPIQQAETDAYPRHGGFFQQGTLLRAHLQ